MKRKKQNFESGLFRQPVREADSRLLKDFLTFQNIVIAMGIVALLFFIGRLGDTRLTFLVAGLGMLCGLMAYEMASRRHWESSLLRQLRQMSQDYDRLVREVARNRNDLSVLKKTLSSAGTLALSYGAQETGTHVEQRMLKAIADRLANLQDGDDTETNQVDDVHVSDFAGLEKESPHTAQDEHNIGAALNDTQVLQVVRAALQRDRIDVFLQPIVSLPQRKKRFYEMLSRIRIKKDVYLPAVRYVAVALEQDLLPVIDNLLLLRGLQLIREEADQDSSTHYFCNISSVTLNDPKFMGDLVEFISQNRALAPRMVFELGHKDMATMSADALPVLDGLAALGCRFSIDSVSSLSFDMSFLEARHIRFIKVEVDVILQAIAEHGGFARIRHLKASLDAQGIDLIVTKIETDKQLLEVLDLDIDYGQGYLFDKPEPAHAAQD